MAQPSALVISWNMSPPRLLATAEDKRSDRRKVSLRQSESESCSAQTFSIQFQLVVFPLTVTELAREARPPGSEDDRKSAGGRLMSQGVDLDCGGVSKQTVAHSHILLLNYIRMCFPHNLVKMCSGSQRSLENSFMSPLLSHRIIFFA